MRLSRVQIFPFNFLIYSLQPAQQAFYLHIREIFLHHRFLSFSVLFKNKD